MDTKVYLLEQFQKCRRRMNLAKILDRGMRYAAAGGLIGVFCELISLFWPFYYAHLAAGLCFLAGFLAGAAHALLHRADLKQAARKLDSFGLQERMVTACELLGQEDEFARMQRQDAFLYYERQKERIRIPLRPHKRHIQAFLLAAFLVMGLGLLPSSAREEAEVRHQVKKEARNEETRLEELIEALQGVEPESMTREQQERLSELLEALQLSREELAKAASWESLASAREKLNYKYGQTARGLEDLAGQLGDPGAAGIADAQALAKAIANEKGVQTASSKTPGNQNGGGEGQDGGDGSGSGNNDGNGQGDESSEGGGSLSGLNGGSAGGQGHRGGQGGVN
ncbi:MAG: hypothetical protein K2O06_18610, partial [Acetatifactor sp.]|nr:hypothetical protein [Acetatifactor sp.]